jgi:hypothetical protein
MQWCISSRHLGKSSHNFRSADMLSYILQKCYSTTNSIFFHFLLPYFGGTRWCSWLRHYATSRMVAASIPDEVIGFFNWPNPSSRTIALGSTQPLTEMSNRNLSGGKGRPARGADLRVICEPIVYKNMGASTSHNPMGFHGLL